MYLHHHWKSALYLIGGAFELAGIVLLAFPDVAPYLVVGWHRTAAALVRAWQRVTIVVRRLLRRRRNVVIGVADSISIAGGLPPRIVVTRGVAVGTLVEQMRTLIEHDRELQERLNMLEGRVDDEAAARASEITALRQHLEREAPRAARNVVERGRRLRAFGTILVAVGALIGTLGNLA
jgi:hypothetical protein